MSDRFQQLGVFVRAAETGSFSRTARELGTTQPSISRTIAALEARLGVKLFLRTTRRITLTEAGSVLLERTRHILPEIDDAEDAARGTDSLRGLIKVAMPIAFGVREVIPRLPALLAEHPELKLDLAMADGAEDLVAEGVDMALRLGRLADSGFATRKLASAPRLLVASPGYLAKRGVPVLLADLAGHDCIFGPGLRDERGGRTSPMRINRPFRWASGSTSDRRRESPRWPRPVWASRSRRCGCAGPNSWPANSSPFSPMFLWRLPRCMPSFRPGGVYRERSGC